jgi:hypothetical protein
MNESVISCNLMTLQNSEKECQYHLNKVWCRKSVLICRCESHNDSIRCEYYSIVMLPSMSLHRFPENTD